MNLHYKIFSLCTLILVSLPLAFDDAAVLALDVSSDLLPAPELVTRIENELAAVRADYPAMERISARPDYMPGQMIIRLTAAVAEEFIAGNHIQLNDLNTLYELESYDYNQFGSYHVFLFHFAHPYNANVLSNLYSVVVGVVYAEPNYLMGDGPDILAYVGESASGYSFRAAWGDCEAGCISDHWWVFSVIGENVSFNDQFGSGILWTDFRAEPDSGIVPLTVQFTDLTLIGADGYPQWQWDFDNDGIVDSEAQHPLWTYYEPGVYTVSLTVSADQMTDDQIKNSYIQVVGEWLPGDVNEDDTLDVTDIIIMVGLILDPDSYTDYDWVLADMDTNGLLDVIDIVIAVNTILFF